MAIRRRLRMRHRTRRFVGSPNSPRSSGPSRAESAEPLSAHLDFPMSVAQRAKAKRPPKPAKRGSAEPTLALGRTYSGVPVPVVVAPREPTAEEFRARIGFPGQPPFTRGVRATMYRGRLWTMRQYAGFGTAKETNRRFRYLLSQGNEGLSVPLDRVSTSMTINATAAILLALYVDVAEEQGVPRAELRGTVQNDILKEYIARSTYIYPPDASMRLAIDVIEFCAREVPKWNAISVSGYHIREAGATAAQEIGFTLANAVAYLEAAVTRGLKIDVIAPQISFFFNAHMDLLEEIAKFRAARRLWSSIMAERFHATKPESLALRFHAQTAGVALTAQQPENNAVRVAIQ